MPEKGDPISLATGSQSESETDYATADGLLAARRLYRSIQRGRPNSADHELPGFGWAWHGLIPGRLVVSGSNEDSAQFLGAEGGIDFFQAPADTGSYSYTEQGISRRTLSAVGTPSANRVDFFQNSASVANGSGEIRLDFGDGEYILFRRCDTFRLSADIRYLVPIEHGFASGYRQWFDYPDTGEYPNRVRDNFGRQINIAWQDANVPGSQISYKVITRLDLPDGTALTYQYGRAPAPSGSQASYYAGNPQDILLSTTHVDASGATLWSHGYLYEDARFPYGLTGIVDQNGQRLSTFAYSDAGLAVSAQQAGGFQQVTVEYLQDDPSQRLQHYIRNVTGPLGQAETYTFFRDEGAPAGMRPTLMRVDRLASATVPASSVVYSYTNTNGYDFMLSGTQDPRGTTAAMAVDTVNRRPTAATEAQGTSVERTTSTTWHPQFDLPAHVVRQGLTTDYSYSATGQLLSVTETDTTSQSVPYTTAGQARTVAYAWDGNGRLLSIDGPRAPDAAGHDDIVTFAYDTSGNRIAMTDGLGHVTHYGGYDANGRPGTMTDMNGIVTQFSYDGLGRVRTIRVRHPSDSSLDAVTTLDYDVEGRVTGIVRPATDALFFDYNLAGLMTAMRGADDERTDYGYDAMGDVTSETVRRADGSAARTTRRRFDSLGRLLSEALGPGRVTHWSYDANGNATTLTDPRRNATTRAFDALDRLVTTVAPDGGTTGLAYDQKDGVTQNTDPGSVTTRFVRDGFGEVIQEVSPDRGTSTYWYDAAGDVTRSQDGRGQVVDYSHDIMGRVTQTVPEGRPAAETVTYTWDTGGVSGSYGVGRLGAIADGSGTTQFAYDHRGNLLIQQQAIGSSAAAQLVYAYDLGDRVTQITYPSGRIVQYGRDGEGRVSLVQTRASASVGIWTAIATDIAYEPFAAVRAMVLGNGLSVANDWGDDGRLASRRLYRTSDGTDLSSLAYGYDVSDNVAVITDRLNEAGSIQYGYDANDRLTQTAVSASAVPAGTDSYGYATGTNRLSSIASAAGTRAITYDGRGNLATDSRPGAIVATASYDGYARLTGYARSDIGTASFVYNGRDDRVAATTGTGTRRFVYDPDGRVLGEYGASAADVKAEFVWTLPTVANDDNPFGGDDGTGGYMPLAVATPDGSGTIVLDWVHGNHLGVPLVTTDASGNAATTPDDYQAPGYPGQSRTAADLYANRYRDYDPTTGRYIQADPSGLQGGQNGYVYAGNNPIRWTDPLGLQAAAAGAAAAAGGGLGLGGAWAAGAAFCAEPVGWFVCGGAAVGGAGYGAYKLYQHCHDGGDDCDEEWADAYAICKAELAKPHPNRGITGGYKDLQNCARGLVSQRCGGNRVTLLVVPEPTALARRDDYPEYEWHNAKYSLSMAG